MSKVRTLEPRGKAAEALDTPTDLSEQAVQEISAAVNAVLADTFALYLKTKNTFLLRGRRVRTQLLRDVLSTARRFGASFTPRPSWSAYDPRRGFRAARNDCR